MNAESPLDPFARLASLGYGPRLIPVVPPGVDLAPGLSLDLRLKAGEDSRGKAPGLRGRDGRWFAMKNWTWLVGDEVDRQHWASIGANAGLRCGEADGEWMVCLDADAQDAEVARGIRELVENAIPGVPTRVGRAPKACYLVRVDGPCPYMLVLFGLPDARGKRQRVELLSSGKQFVAMGAHPSGKPYEWTTPLPAFDDLPRLGAERMADLMRRIRAILPNAGKLDTASADSGDVDQRTLAGDPETVARVMRALPNADSAFPRREDYLDVGYALKAALPGREKEALGLYLDWCSRWDAGENDLGIAEADWNRMKPPFRRGAGWLLEKAEELSGGAFKRSSQWFEQPDLAEAASAPVDELESFRARDLSDDPPPQRWHVRGWIPHGQTTILSGDGGTGKSLIALQLAIAGNMGANHQWLGEPVEQGPVLFLSAEDEREEIHRRVAAIARSLGVTPAALGEGLEIVSLHGKDAVLATIDAKNPMLLKPTRLMQRLDKTLSRLRPRLVVLDTQADLFGGKENERAHARQFIGYLQRIAQAHDCAVLLLSHPSMSGMASGSGASGVTAWSNSVRSRLYLSRQIDKDGAEADYRVLSGKKANRGRVGLTIGLRYRDGVFDLSEKTDDNNDQRGDDAVFLKILRRANINSDFVTISQNTKRFAPKALAADPEGAKIGEARLDKAMRRLLASGAIAQESYGPPSRPSYRLKECDAEKDDLFIFD